jgi:PleD family two-component response regulator
MFNDQSFDAPIIHVVSESPRLEMLQARLRQNGIRPVPVRGKYLPPDTAPALIDLSTRQMDIDPGDQRLIVTVGREEQAPSHSDIHLTDVSELNTLAARISIREREKQRRREIDLRSQTLAEFGIERPRNRTPGKMRLLWLGHDAPFLNVIKTNLNENGINLVAAISCLTAEDYLESGRFKALALCPSHPGDEACKLLERVKQIPLAHPPKTLLLLRREVSVQLDKELIEKADQIIDVASDLEAVAARIRSAFSELNMPIQTASGFNSVARDATSGLVSRAYLETHLQAQMAQSDQMATPLSVISIDLKGDDDVRAVAQKINALLRDTDLAARLDMNHICVTLPDTPYRGAVVLARRIEDSMARSVAWRVIEKRQFHTLTSLLGGLTARSGFSSERRA